MPMFEPEIDKRALGGTLGEVYGVDALRLIFVPEGFASYCYIAHSSDGNRYFLKLQDTTRRKPMAASDPDFYLSATWNLHSRGLFRNLTYPIRALDGALRTRFGQYSLIVFNYIDGQALNDTVPSGGQQDRDLLPAMARSVGSIHASTPYLGIEHAHIERFCIPFRDLLLDAVRDLERVGAGDRRGKRSLADLLLPREDALLACLARLDALREAVLDLDMQMVLCHTDLWGGNVMLGGDGQLYIIDWEGAMIAPPEHDLFIFLGDRFGSFLRYYKETAGPVTLDAQLFGFYLYRRNLEDLTDWIVRILYENSGDDQDRDDLKGVADSVSQWRDLEVRIGDVDAQLSRH